MLKILQTSILKHLCNKSINHEEILILLRLFGKLSTKKFNVLFQHGFGFDIKERCTEKLYAYFYLKMTVW